MSSINRRKPAYLVLALAVGATGMSVGPASAGPAAPKVEVRGAAAKGAIKDRYIVVFSRKAERRDVENARDRAERDGGRVHYQFRRALKGFAATMPARAVERLQQNPRVQLIEADQEVHTTATQSPATWGLDRIDQRLLPLSNSYTYGVTGDGVRAYVIDTGIRPSHSDFGSRVTSGFTSVNDGRGTNDCNGHGTHVAGTVGGSTYGVAKDVDLVPVRVLACNGSGTWSGVIAGIDWVTEDHQPGQPAVANMSLGGGFSSAVNAAVANSVADGVTYAVAAGNDNRDACDSSPASAPQALTAGATTTSDARASYSNYGSCVDVFAPGSSITSAWYTSNTATNTISGTSMASPHVAGVAALYLHANPSATPQTVADAINGGATPNVINNAGSGSPNRLLHSGITGSGNPPPPPPPSSSACSSYPIVHNGTLSGSGQTAYTPSSSGFSASSGVHKGCLDGPDVADFDLHLQKRSAWGSWSNVASSATSSPDETITYSGTSGTYRWRVVSYRGGGSYTLGTQRP